MNEVTAVVITDADGVDHSFTPRQVASALSTFNKGALGAVISAVANHGLMHRVADDLVNYQMDVNLHPTLVQATLDLCWRVLNIWGYRLENLYVDQRLEAGKELTVKLTKLVDDGTLGGGLPCV